MLIKIKDCSIRKKNNSATIS